jgi:hypothetical protein
MKIRQGFVSNSSSSSFVVYVPKNFELTDEIMEIAINTADEIDIDDENELNTFKENVVYAIDSLKSGKSIHEYDIDYDVFNSVYEILEKNNLIVTSINGGPDDGKIVGLSETKVKQIMEKFNSIKL